MGKKFSKHRSEKKRAPRPEPAREKPALGAIVELTVDEFAPTGDAIARFGNYVIFLRDAIPGEKVRARVTVAKQRFGRADLVEVIDASPMRVEPRCKHFGECGRCTYQHLPYEEQLRHKTEVVAELISRALAGKKILVRPMRGMPEPWGTRNKAHFALTTEAGKPRLGHFRPHETTVLPIEECPVHHPLANEAAEAVLHAIEHHRVPVYREENRTGSARHIVVRTSQSTGETLALFVAAQPRLDHVERFGKRIASEAPHVVGIHRMINADPGPAVIKGTPEKLFGADTIIEHVAGVEYRLSPTSFFQTSVKGAEILVEIVCDVIVGSAVEVLDVYSGVGLFALPLAKRGCKVLGVEVHRKAVADAKVSAIANGVADRCEFLAAPAERLFERLTPRRRFDAVVLDPPREGCDVSVLRGVVALHPKMIVCVSCEPAALARELAFLVEHRYLVRFVQPVDMFPHTSQIEAVAVLDRVEQRRDFRSNQKGRRRR